MADIVSVTDIGERHSARRAESFFQREEVRKSLARMIQIGQRINNGNTRKRCQGVQGFLRKYARYDSVDPTRKAPRDVSDRFALAETRVRVVEQNGRAPHAYNAHFEGHTRAQGGFFKNHGEETARESVLITIRVRLDVRRQTKQLADLRGVPLRAG